MENESNSKSEATSSIYHSGEYLKRNPLWHTERSEWKAQQIAKGVKAKNLQVHDICDIGCGAGLVTYFVAEELGLDGNVVGFEPSDDAPVLKDVADRVDIRRELAENSNEKFDLYIMMDVFEHVDDYIGFLKSVKHLAKYQVFHIPLDISVNNLLRSQLLRTRNSVGHLHYFNRATALATLEYCGYKPIHDFYTKAAWDGPDRKKNSPINILRRLMFKVSPTMTSLLLGGLSLLVVSEIEK